MRLSEDDVQGLKAQEAKDLAIKLLRKLRTKEKAPISPGEVQLKELQYELRLKEAEVEDNRQRESHQERLKKLELQIEQERARQAEADSRAQRVGEEHVRLVEQVREAGESLSVQLERTTREHNLKVEKLDADFAARQADLQQQLHDMQEQRDQLRHEIEALAELQETAEDIGQLREEMESRRQSYQQELQQLDEQVATLEFEKTKRISATQREQELEIARLDTQHKKDVLQMNRQAAEQILADLEMIAIAKTDWQQSQQALEQNRARDQEELAALREKAREELRKEYNITTSELMDVTDLYYRQQATSREAEALRGQVEKLDTEIRRMRQHVEQEPQRIAAAVEAARTQVQNYIEQGGKR